MAASDLIVSVSGIRGVVGAGLTPQVAMEYALAFGSSLGAGSTVVVSRDGRPHGPMLLHAVLAGLAAAGCKVRDLGTAPTPTCGYMVKYRGAAGGVMVTASHNPAEYNGLKLFRPEGFVLSPGAGAALSARFAERRWTLAGWDDVGSVEAEADPYGEHLHKVRSLVDAEAIRGIGFKVVLDANHGSGGAFGPRLLVPLGCRATVLGDVPDGRFTHLPEPIAANLTSLGDAVRAAGADVGFAVDPDADRLAIVDETGRYIGEELTLALALLHRTSQQAGPVVLNASTSLVSEAVAKAAGCTVHRTPVGEVHVAERMIAEGAVLGGEGNGGVIDPRVGFIRDSAVGMALILDLLAARRQKLSAIVAELPVFHLVKKQHPAPRMGLPALLDAVAAAFPDAAADRADGLRLAWPDAWLQVRGSNTEPIIRVFAESADAARSAALTEQVAALLSS